MKNFESIVKKNAWLDNRTWSYLDVVENAVSRLDESEIRDKDDEAIFCAIDDALIYTRDQWTIIEEWCTPSEVNYDLAMEYFTDDVFVCVAKIRDALEDDDEPSNDDESAD